ncbi:hypothetical protein Tco_1398520 [Tanacetum coccineum]
MACQPSSEPPSDHRSTVVNGGQWWPTTVNGSGPPSDHRLTTAGPPVNQRSTVVDRQSTAGSGGVILSEDDNDRGCRKSSDLEGGFYKDIIKLGPEYLTEMDDE